MLVKTMPALSAVAVVATSLLAMAMVSTDARRWALRCPAGDYLSLPQCDADEDGSRAASLVALQSQIFNSPRFHKVANMEVPMPLFVGPSQQSQLALGLAFAEAKDIQDRTNVERDGKLGAALAGIAQGAFPIATLDDLANMYNAFTEFLPIPTSSIDWASDASFASDRLTILGQALRLVTALPTWHEDVADATTTLTGVSLQCLVDGDRLFEVDLSFAGELSARSAGEPLPSAKYVPGAHALFYVDDKGAFMPLAIHLVESALSYTPLDDPDHWTFAKIAFSAAEGNFQQWEHFVFAHQVMEPLRVEAFRHLAANHPLNVLLMHHFKNIFGNTLLAQSILLQNGTVHDNTFGFGAVGALKFFQRRMQEYTWAEQDFIFRVESRGLHHIPCFKFRDDALRLHRIISGFVSDFLKQYYRLHRDLVEDFELQAFAAASAEWVPGFPSSFQTRKELVSAATDMVFTVAVHHHAMNSDVTWLSSGYPMGTKALWQPLPTSKTGPIALRAFMPPVPHMFSSIGLFAAFKRDLTPDESLIHSYEALQLGTHATTAIARFQRRLERLSRKIQRRERGNPRPYTVLDPANLPYFVWI